MKCGWAGLYWDKGVEEIKILTPFRIQGGSQKLLLTTIEITIVSSGIFSGPPCIAANGTIENHAKQHPP